MISLRLNPDGLHKPIGCYSQVARRGNMVAASGMASIDLKGEVVGPNDIAAQTIQTLTNLRAALAGAGATLDDVIKVNVYLSDFAHYPGMDAAYRTFFPGAPPARATLRADLVYPTLLVEMEGWAVVEDAPT
jgi:enamine deaminase RidA (YjgF/YER057c/UK114 family)